MSADIETAALAIHAQRRKTFTVGPAPHVVPVTITGPKGSAWEIRFSAHMSAEGIATIVESVARVMQKPNANPELVAFALAYIQAESDNVELSSGGAS